MKTVNIRVTEGMATCPYCKHDNLLYPNLSIIGPAIVECERCGKKFQAEMDITTIEF